DVGALLGGKVGAKIAEQPRAQILGLADVEDLAGGRNHSIDAGALTHAGLDVPEHRLDSRLDGGRRGAPLAAHSLTLRSLLARGAPDGDAVLEGVRRTQRGAAARTGLALAAVHLHETQESAAAAVWIPVVAEARAALLDCRAQNADRLAMEQGGLSVRERRAEARRADARAPERLVRIDVSDARHAPLVHEDRLDRPR